MFNSVHDDLAYAPFGEASGWLVTGGRGSTAAWKFGRCPGWRPVDSCQLEHPMGGLGEVVPGTMTLADAQTNEPLAVVGLEQERAMECGGRRGTGSAVQL